MAGIVVRDDNIGRVALTSTGRASVTYEPGEKEVRDTCKRSRSIRQNLVCIGSKKNNYFT